jgi:hypothetical protein
MSIFLPTPPVSPLPSTYAGLPGDIDDWSCDQWKIYYTRLKVAFGQAKAIAIISQDSANTSILTSDSQFCKYDCSFVQFFAKEGLSTGNIFSKAYCTVDSVVTAVQNTADTASNVTGGLKTFTSNKILSVGLFAGIGYIVLKEIYPGFLKNKK